MPVDVFEWRQEQAVPEPVAADGVEVSVMSADHPGRRDALEGRFEATAPSLLARGDTCYLATVDGRFGGWLWFSRLPVQRDPWSGLRIRLAPDEAYTYAMWAEPELRSLGIGGRLMSTLLRDVQADAATRRLYGWVDRENREMQMLVRMMFGFAPVQRVTRLRLLDRVGWQVPLSDRPRFGPVSRAGRHSDRRSAR